MKTIRSMAGIVVLGLLAIGPLPAAAQGRVNILCSPDPAWCEAVKQSFGKATGIQTEFVRLSSGAALARLRAEKDAPVFDVWFGGSGDSQWVAQAEGLTEFFKPKAWGELRPQLTKAVDGHYIPLYTGLHGLGGQREAPQGEEPAGPGDVEGPRRSEVQGADRDAQPQHVGHRLPPDDHPRPALRG